MWRGGLTWRRLGVLVAHLPPESATKTALREALTDEQQASLPAPVGHGPWSQVELLLALVADRLAILSWQQGGDNSVPQPKPLPRPGVAASQTALTSEQRAQMQAQRDARRLALEAEA